MYNAFLFGAASYDALIQQTLWLSPQLPFQAITSIPNYSLFLIAIWRVSPMDKVEVPRLHKIALEPKDPTRCGRIAMVGALKTPYGTPLSRERTGAAMEESR